MVDVNDRLTSLALPRLNDAAIIDEIISEINRKAEDAGYKPDNPFAVRVVPDKTDVEVPKVGASQILRYRSGGRCFCWLDGDFDPDSSFLSATQIVIDNKYPNNHDDTKFSFKLIAEAATNNIKSRNTDLFNYRNWQNLEQIIYEIIKFKYDFISEAGNDEKLWTISWWNAIDLFLTNLDNTLVTAQPGSRDPIDAYAIAGLPRPSGNNWFYKNLSAKQYVEIIKFSFNTPQKILDTLSLIERKFELDSLILKTLGWNNNFNSKVIVEPSLILAILKQGLNSNFDNRLLGWKELREEFFLWLYRPDISYATVTHNDDALLSLPYTNKEAFIIPLTNDHYIRDGERKIKIDDIIFHIPWENCGNVNTDDVNDIFHYTGRLGIEVASVASSGNKLIINTSITYQLRNNAKWPWSPLRISIIPSANSRLHGQINAQVSILLPVIWTSSSIVSYKIGRNSKIFVGNAQQYTIDSHEIVPVEEEGINELVIKDVYTSSIIIANISQDSIEESSFPQSENTIFNGYKSISSCDLEDNSFLTIDGEPKLDVTIAIPEKDPPWLPLAATALGQKPNSNQPLDDMTGDMRGRIESLIATFNKQYIDNGDIDPKSGLIQMVIPTGAQYNYDPKMLNENDGVKWLCKSFDASRNINNIGTGPSQSLLTSDEYLGFWSSYKSIITKLQKQLGRFTDVEHQWISRCQLNALDKEIIDNYLISYTNLIKAAEAVSVADKFWATYPFSVFIYNSENYRLDAIYLSPLHPIRISWLFGCESAIKTEKSINKQIIQLIEGWNIPWVGPAPSPSGDSVFSAFPIDSGSHQLFIGWSALTYFDNSIGSVIKMPALAGSKSCPGGSSSGLNDGGVSAAIRDYFNVYPHKSTFSVDLYSSQKNARSNDLDDGIVRELSTIMDKKKSSLIGGVRVLDNLNREGDIPNRDKTLAIFNQNKENDARLEWMRYNSNNQNSDIRFVEDAKVIIGCEIGGQKGSMPKWPIKRFAVRTLNQDGNNYNLDFSITGNVGLSWSQFLEALNSIELSSGTAKSLKVNVPDIGMVGIGKGPKWVVTGGVNLDPSSISQLLLSSNGTPRMLWEWRPPYFEAKKEGFGLRFDRRAYNTIAEIPDMLKENISSTLHLSDEKVDEVLRNLGFKGIGLSSLFAMGGNHATGALGFHFSYKVMELPDSLKSANRCQVIIPLDAADSFLRALTKSDISDIQKRADLLLIDIETDENTSTVRFAPVEVTHRNIGKRNPYPPLNSTTVKEKIKQLDDSFTLIDNMVNNFHHDSSLSLAALSSIIDAAFHLSGQGISTDLRSNILKNILAGKVNLNSRRGVMFYFQDQPEGNNTRPFVWRPGSHSSNNVNDSGKCFGVLFVDPNLNDTELWDNASGPLKDQVDDVFRWLFDQDSTQVVEIKVGSQSTQHTINNGNTDSEDEEDVEDLIIEDEEEEEGGIDTNDDESGERIIVKLGNAIDSPSDEIIWDPFNPIENRRLMNGHMVILGGSGSGKTQAMKAIQLELSKFDIPSITFDFNDDFIDSDFLSNTDSSLFDVTQGLPINPLSLPIDPYTGNCAGPQMVNQMYLLKEIFKKVFTLGPQQASDLKNGIQAAYHDFGIRSNTPIIDENARLPSFSDVYNHISDNQRLLNRIEAIFDLDLFGNANFTMNRFLEGKNVLRFSQLPSEEIQKVTSEIMLVSIYNALIKMGHYRGLRLAIFIDEAHKIANLEAVKKLFREARKYGCAVFLSSQEARDFDETIYANAGTRIILNLQEMSDARKAASMLGDVAERNELADIIKNLSPFHGYIINNQYTSNVSFKVKAYFERVE
jgi:hypothetical protein